MGHARTFQVRWRLENQRRLEPTFPLAETQFIKHENESHLFRVEEENWIRVERNKIHERVAKVPHSADEFISWFESLREDGPGQNDPLFPWLERDATLDQLRWFIGQEVAGEAGFDDLVALTQIKVPVQSKLELARNYWDEMGRGTEKGMHGPLLSRVARELGIQPGEKPSETVTESLTLANLLVSFAFHRRYFFHSIGALGAIELTAPGRAAHVYSALKRHGISAEGCRYFLLHSTLDVKHSEAWNREVLRPLVTRWPEAASSIAEGALLRLEMGRRCFERYRLELNLGSSV